MLPGQSRHRRGRWKLLNRSDWLTGPGGRDSVPERPGLANHGSDDELPWQIRTRARGLASPGRDSQRARHSGPPGDCRGDKARGAREAVHVERRHRCVRGEATRSPPSRLQGPAVVGQPVPGATASSPGGPHGPRRATQGKSLPRRALLMPSTAIRGVDPARADKGQPARRHLQTEGRPPTRDGKQHDHSGRPPASGGSCDGGTQ